MACKGTDLVEFTKRVMKFMIRLNSSESCASHGISADRRFLLNLKQCFLIQQMLI